MPKRFWRMIGAVCLLGFWAACPAPTASAWQGQLKDGTVITETDLRRIVAQHQTWLESRTKEGQKAELAGATLAQAPLAGANLIGANLKEAELYMANLNAAMLEYADLRKARLFGANLQNAMLGDADLRGALLGESNLKGAMLWKADLRGANLEGADLRRASFFGANLEGADLARTALAAVVWEPKAGGLPVIARLVSAKGLEHLIFKESPAGLMELRQAFLTAGFRWKERQVTYALRHELLLRMPEPGRTVFYLLFEWPCAWGRDYIKPVGIIFGLIPFFAVLYIIALYTSRDRALWRVWPPGPENPDAEKPRLAPIAPEDVTAELCALYFSLLCAFRIGWGVFSPETWLKRLAPHEYEVRAVGWARSVAGVQSLISIYLAAMAVFSFFGRPFG